MKKSKNAFELEIEFNAFELESRNTLSYVNDMIIDKIIKKSDKNGLCSFIISKWYRIKYDRSFDIIKILFYCIHIGILSYLLVMIFFLDLGNIWKFFNNFFIAPIIGIYINKVISIVTSSKWVKENKINIIKYILKKNIINVEIKFDNNLKKQLNDVKKFIDTLQENINKKYGFDSIGELNIKIKDDV
ncbi:hypothetical protein [Mycoplasma sp. CSL7503-lung]|uniref:hypothetical protein n=1 Tax=Mycoplasma sp. CSL7503-lung TaxID=536372 RepID=UPI0021D0FF5D|nr:hypothetical protein [Mycoplasma sp. CSL7503-lung]MCU4706395.1 hypothetical protein [Mycoplasma sp. CSL7503-lung]